MISYFLVGLGIIILVLFIWWFPKWQTRKARRAKDIKLIEKWQAENEFRKILIQIIGGLIIISGIILSWNEFQQSREEFRESQERFRKSQEIDKAGQISSRFIQAINLLSVEKTTTRIGAIYTLEQIVKESPKDYLQTVLDVLTTFIRDFEYLKYQGKKESILVFMDKFYEKWNKIDKKKIDNKQKKNEKFRFVLGIKIYPEVQAALTVIGRIRYDIVEDFDPELIKRVKDLKDELRMELYWLNRKGKFYINDLKREFALYKNKLEEKINSYTIDLNDSILFNADLNHAYLCGSEIRGAILINANLSYSNLSRASLNFSDCWGAYLLKADLNSTVLDSTNLREANLEESDLSNAYLFGTNLSGSKLHKANFEGALLGGTIFNKTIGLKFEQLLNVKYIREAKGLKYEIEAEVKKLKPELFID